MAERKPSITVLRYVLQDLGLISEQDFQTITGATDKTLESWRKRGKYFPYVRLGSNYYYPIVPAKQFVDDLIEEKIKKAGSKQAAFL